MSDLYSAPQVTVDDGVVDRRARRNAVAGFVSSLLVIGSLVIYLGTEPPALEEVIDWVYAAVATVVVCTVAGMVMSIFPRIPWPLICLVAPVFAFAMLLALTLVILAFP